jgi:magnesium chelatase subunit I
MQRFIFPFSAIVGQDALKTALILNVVDPGIGGLVIRGQKGTGKSTAVRALAHIVPEIDVVDSCAFHCSPHEPETMHPDCLAKLESEKTIAFTRIPMPIIELPLNATDDRITGTLNLEQALQSGERRFEPGLLASANRGILYVDEVNLLEDHLVDVLLDAAASGVNIVEREGISFSHQARFILIGTMNPEEGELRPQFLDRFALCVEVDSLSESHLRKEIIHRRLSFEKNPQQFINQWSTEQDVLRKQIGQARSLLAMVTIPEEMVDLAVQLALAVKAHGHRAEITIVRAARALAALMENTEVNAEHIAAAARLALPHRNSSSPLHSVTGMYKIVNEIIDRTILNQAQPIPVNDPDLAFQSDLEAMQIPGSAAAGSIFFDFLKKKVKKK